MPRSPPAEPQEAPDDHHPVPDPADPRHAAPAPYREFPAIPRPIWPFPTISAALEEFLVDGATRAVALVEIADAEIRTALRQTVLADELGAAEEAVGEILTNLASQLDALLETLPR